MPLLRRPAGVLRRPAAAVLRRPAAALSADRDEEAEDADQTPRSVYLVSLSRVLPDTVIPAGAPPLCDPSTWTREAVRDAILDCTRNLIHIDDGRGGRPRQEPIVVKKHVDLPGEAQ